MFPNDPNRIIGLAMIEALHRTLDESMAKTRHREEEIFPALRQKIANWWESFQRTRRNQTAETVCVKTSCQYPTCPE